MPSHRGAVQSATALASKEKQEGIWQRYNQKSWIRGSQHFHRQNSQLLREGLIAGILGAATIAVWFLIVDSVRGQPFYTPSILGTALFKDGVTTPESLGVDLEVVFLFTWVHGLVFTAVGWLASWLLGIAERNPQIGFGILLFFVVFEFGFISVCHVLAEPVLHALAWPAIIVGNLLAAIAMGAYFWRHHLDMHIEP